MSSNSSFSLPIPDKEMLEAISDFLLSDDYSPTPDDLVHPTNEWTDKVNRKMLELRSALSCKNKPDLRDEVPELFLGMTQEEEEEHFASPHSVNMPNKKKKKVVHDSNDLKGKGLLSPGEPSKYGRDRDPIPANRNERQYEVQGLDKNEEKKKVHDSNNVKGKRILPEREPEHFPLSPHSQKKEEKNTEDVLRYLISNVSSPTPEKEMALERNGTWSEEEKRLFRSGLEKYGSDRKKWKKIARYIGTRSSEQVRSLSRRAKQNQ